VADTLQAFIARWSGRYAQAPGGLGGQCVDLANLWLLNLGLPPIRANAIGFRWTIEPGFAWVGNTAAGVPSPSDLVVWGPDVRVGVTDLGHVAIFVAGDRNSFVSFEANWPLGSFPHVQRHDYRGVVGWQHLISQLDSSPGASPPAPSAISTPAGPLLAVLVGAALLVYADGSGGCLG
jgi:hypothetical protein